MRRSIYLPYFILILITVFTLACLGSAAVATPTLAPTDTPMPTDTPVPPTATEIPPTDTPVPPTATPRPTFTPTPGPGDIIYNTDFDDFRNWHAEALQEGGKMSAEVEERQLVVQIDSQDTYGYAFYRGNGLDPKSADQVIETVVRRIDGTNRNNISLVCRGSEKGWYEFSISSGGLYDILFFEIDTGNYELIASGGSTAINLQDKPNKLKAVCEGDTLSFIVNDAVISIAHDSRLISGDTYGLSVSTFGIGDVTVAFDYYTVRIPDDDDTPDATSTPIVLPTSANAAGGGQASEGATGGSRDGTWIGITSLAGGMGFRIENNSITVLLIDQVIPGCEDITPFAFVGVSTPLSGNSFSYELLGMNFTGTFSGQAAGGTLGCAANPNAASWYAELQP